MFSATFNYIGNKVIDFFSKIGSLTILLFQTIKWIFKKPFDLKLIIDQMVRIGVESLPVAAITALFTGMVLALQTGLTMESKLRGISQFVGGVVCLSMVRELGPVLTAVIVAGRIGSSIAAEIGTMRVTEQIDALETLATSPVKYLSVPRFLALIFMLPALTVISDFIGVAGGAVVSYFELKIPFMTYYYNSQQALRMGDIYSGMIKTVFFGVIIAIVSCQRGFETTGGAEGVGHATTDAVVTSSILILISDYFLTSFLNFTLHI